MNDDERLSDWYVRYRARLVSYLTSPRWHLRHEDAADIVQETFVKVVRKAAAYRGDAEWTYLKVAVHNEAANFLRAQEAQMRKGSVPLETAFDVHDRKPSAEQALVSSQTTQDVKRMFAEVMAAVPELTRLCFYEQRRGLSYKEIAAKLGTTVAAVQSRLYDLRQRFHARVGELPPDIDWPAVAGDTGHDHEE